MSKLPVTKGDKKNLNFLKVAVSDDYARPVLQGVNISGGLAATANGFVLHVIPDYVLTFSDSVGGTVLITDKKGEKDTIEATPIVGGMYPAYQEILPDPKKAVFAIAVNPGLLAKTLSQLDPDRPVILRFYGETLAYEVYGSTQNLDPAYALIMPAYIPEKSHMEWSPRTKGDVIVYEKKAS